jgi:hypothetical protein
MRLSLVCLPGLDGLVKALHAGLHVKAILISNPSCSMRAAEPLAVTVSKQEQVLVPCRCGDVQEVSE